MKKQLKTRLNVKIEELEYLCNQKSGSSISDRLFRDFFTVSDKNKVKLNCYAHGKCTPCTTELKSEHKHTPHVEYICQRTHLLGTPRTSKVTLQKYNYLNTIDNKPSSPFSIARLISTTPFGNNKSLLPATPTSQRDYVPQTPSNYR